MKLFLLPAAALALSACQMSVTDEPLPNNPEALIGRTLVHEDGNLTINPDGTLGGDIEGTWEIRNNQWCRTITKPERFADSKCLDVRVTGNNAQITRDTGASFTLPLK
ncbi:hypothetical protein [uncultured Pelagimonas sp.]|uniref:hypothetical protein n=1 Tax=uncultured Pelagimonas sp. TaxID=1618102 RepID=UPI002602E4E8|nr:hypothetical protein [uncultured Pelagimonas sp.]